MYFRYDDLTRLTLSVPFMRLIRPSSAIRSLTRAADDAEELAPVLRQYPQIRYEALEFHYICLQSLGALSRELVEDLTGEFGWRGLVWASMLACLAPSEEYRRSLEAARPRQPRQAWAVDLALAHLGAPCPVEVGGLKVQLGRLRDAFSACTIPKVTLRLMESSSAHEARRAAVSAAYKSGGAKAALKAIHNADQ
jgi:hypothetical protein